MKGKRSERARKVGDLVSCYDERAINGCLNAKGSMFITFVIHLFVKSAAIQNVFSLEKFVSLFKYNVFFCGMKMLVQTEMVLKNENRIQKTPNEWTKQHLRRINFFSPIKRYGGKSEKYSDKLFQWFQIVMIKPSIVIIWKHKTVRQRQRSSFSRKFLLSETIFFLFFPSSSLNPSFVVVPRAQTVQTDENTLLRQSRITTNRQIDMTEADDSVALQI